MYRRLARNTAINFVNLGVNIVLGLLLAPWFIHALGSERYGLWVLALSLSVTRGVLVVFDLGIQGTLTKFVAEYHAKGEQERVNAVFSAALLAYFLIGIIVCMGMLALARSSLLALFQIPPAQLEIAQWLISISALQTLYDFPALATVGVLEGLERFDVTRGMNIARHGVFVLLAALFLSCGWHVYALALATFLAELFRLIGHSLALRRILPVLRLTRQIARDAIRQMLTLSGWLFLFSLAMTIYSQMDQLIISTRLSTTLLTDYDISYRLHTLVFALTTLIGPFMVAAASALYAKGEWTALRDLFLRATRYTAILTAPAVLLVIVLAEPLTVYWVGAEYAHTVTVTRLYVAYLLFWLLLRVGQNMLIGLNKVERFLPIMLLGIGVNLGLSWWLAPRFGILGVVIGTVVGNLLMLWPYLRLFEREFAIPPRLIGREIIGRVYPSAIVSAAAVWLLQTLWPAHHLVLVGGYGAGGMLLFGLLYFIFGAAEEERQLLRRAWQRLRSATIGN